MGLQYVARKPLKVAGRTVQPGEIVPEAATWKNVKAYVNNGSLAVAVEVSEGAVEHADLKAQVAEMADRLAALERLVVGAGEQEGDVEVIDKPDGGDAGGDDPDAHVEPIDMDSLDAISREDLDARAVALGIDDAPKRKNKTEVATAINAALAQREAN